MENFSEILNYIGRTNLFNFIIFFSIIVFLIKKMDVAGKLEAAKDDISKNIEHSKTVKIDSESVLKEVEDSVAHLEDEIDSIIKKSEENARLVGDKIIEDAHGLVANMRDGVNKAAEARAALLKNDILSRALNASIEVAKDHIMSELRNNPDLHYKLIDESVDALSGVSL